jgi:hypothetical protein
VTTQVASGARVESQSDYQAVVVKGKSLNHVLHLIITLVTLGTWGFVWIPLAIFGGEKRSMVAWTSTERFGPEGLRQDALRALAGAACGRAAIAARPKPFFARVCGRSPRRNRCHLAA